MQSARFFSLIVQGVGDKNKRCSSYCENFFSECMYDNGYMLVSMNDKGYMFASMYDKWYMFDIYE